ncbi:hypothetical protein BSZ39_04295 [Bowdeniella nasicola]|uniref:4Fe-4S ferredoxin-type domain-containing protein n=1 Tax=Bowdeniella nasicola TaxID=208480 RepID=A0A1Q5Q3X5_9ACTO|nr:4Fe-4S binding protein [Bowdeniella nasicola]OKL54382.1 hypothetical protein BSZ39_04295 [Bowdeniella nasicola]
MSTSSRLNPPALIDTAACVRSNDWACAACAATCPNDAIELTEGGARVSVADCTGCGACVTACPASAISAETVRIQRADGACYLACHEAGGASPCLAGLEPEDVLASLQAGDSRIDLYTGQCDTCPVAPESRVAESVDALRAAAQVSGLGLPVTRFSDRPAPSATRQVAIDRRQLFAVLPPDAPAATGNRGAPQVRESFIAALGHRSWHPLYPRPRVCEDASGRSTCTGCRACVSACPTRALSALDVGASFSLSVEPSDCVGCGICVETCPVDALSLVCDFAPPPPVITQVFAAHCERCNRPLYPGETTLCTSCDSRAAIAADVWSQLDG